MAYNHMVSLRSLQHVALYLVQTDSELKEWIDFVGGTTTMSKHDINQITGAVLLVYNGDLLAIWFTEDSAWYDLTAIYRPLPYYSKLSHGKNVPEYHKESLDCYDISLLNAICDDLLADWH